MRASLLTAFKAAIVEPPHCSEGLNVDDCHLRGQQPLHRVLRTNALNYRQRCIQVADMNVIPASCRIGELVDVKAARLLSVSSNRKGRGGVRKIEQQSHEPNREASGCTALPSNVQEDQTALPSASRIRQEGVPVSRSERRSANGSAQRKLAARSAQ